MLLCVDGLQQNNFFGASKTQKKNIIKNSKVL